MGFSTLPNHDPGANKLYGWTLGNYCGTRTLTASTWTAENSSSDPGPYAAIVFGTATYTNTGTLPVSSAYPQGYSGPMTSVWISWNSAKGMIGDKPLIRNHFTLSDGTTDTASFILPIKEC